MMQKILKIISKYKIISVIIIAAILFGGYFGYQKIKNKNAAVRYVTAAAEKGTIITSVSGSGQISASNQTDVKSKVSGDAIYVGVKNGQEVKTGTLLVQLDDSDAKKTVRDAEANLESAKLSLEKLEGPEGLAVPRNKQNAQDDLKKAYDDEFNTVANAFIDLPTVMTGLQNVLFGYDFTQSQWNIDFYADAVRTYDEKVSQYRDDAYTKYQAARTAYNQNFQTYKSTDRYSSTDVVEALTSQTYETTKIIADAIKSANNLIQFYKDKLTERNLTPRTLADTHLTNLNTYMGKANTHLVNLLSAQNTIKDDKDAILNADLDIKSQELSIQQKENALLDAKEKLADYFIYAPFGGVITEVSVKKGDSVSGSTVLAVLLAKQRIAEISLNEVDVAKVKVGQKVNLTFDAVSDLTISGEVEEIDTIGAVTQGVVTYGVKIIFDTQDERVKPGMSVSTAIITDVRQDVIVVSSSAVKVSGTIQYVEVLNGDTIQNQSVETGLSNDTMTEIISGLNEGDKVVTQTISAGTAKTQTQQNSSLQIPGITGGR
jgi:HlyD family secretion protein